MAKIILLLQFSWSSVWWPYIQFVCWCCRCTGPGQYNDSINIQIQHYITIWVAPHITHFTGLLWSAFSWDFEGNYYIFWEPFERQKFPFAWV